MISRTRRLLASALASLVLLAAPGWATAAEPAQSQAFDRIEQIYNLVEAQHKDGVDLEAFIDGAIRGGLETLADPHTNYFSTEEWAQFQADLEGRFAGIGVYLDQAGEFLIVNKPIPESPAARAGLQAGDVFLAADGVSLQGVTMEEAQSRLRGEPGTQVQLTMERPGVGPYEVTLTRAEIQVPVVEYRMLQDGVGYLMLSQFGDTAPAEVGKAIAALKRDGATQLVLDLRQNPGGYVSAVLMIAGGWVPRGEPVLIEVSRDGEEVYRSFGGEAANLETVVLVDGGTASAAEILAGAIQEQGGRLVGSQTYGKGTIQQLMSLPGSDGLKVTIAEYLTGARRKVDGVGLTPDVVVEPPYQSELMQPVELERTLALNDVGLDVLAVQERLAFLGYAHAAHGGFDYDMLSLVRHFRLMKGLPAADVVDEAFVTALEAAVGERMTQLAAEDPALETAIQLLTVDN